jgi:tRNA1Val (adenine37-N6)-methyltransferase
MPNTYFQFKQFTIHQEKAAMKVCTDACLFGAWMADRIVGQEAKPAQILDIGAGTGLLSMMLAQAIPASIDAIELDEQAAEQALQNFEASPWHERMQVLQGDARSVHTGKKYDLIISNPPFFENDLKSPDRQRNLALHSSELGLDELLSVIQQYLSPHGRFAVLLPWHRKEAFVKMAETQHFFLVEEMDVRQTGSHSRFRTMLLFSRNRQDAQRGEITIRNQDGYTPAFIQLLKDYYLHL